MEDLRAPTQKNVGELGSVLSPTPGSPTADEATGHPPMSHVTPATCAREISTTPSPTFSSSPRELSNSSTDSLLPPRPHILIPEPAEEEDPVYDLLYPKTFESTDDALLPAPKNFFGKKIDSDERAATIARRLLTYFSRPLSGWYEEIIHNRDGSETIVKKPYTAPLPLISEFANMHGLTESELKSAAKNFPDTLGRALAFAADVIKTNLVRKGLTEEYSPQFAKFVATNETNMTDKSEHTEKRITVNLNELAKQIAASPTPLNYDE